MLPASPWPFSRYVIYTTSAGLSAVRELQPGIKLRLPVPPLWNAAHLVDCSATSFSQSRSLLGGIPSIPLSLEAPSLSLPGPPEITASPKKSVWGRPSHAPQGNHPVTRGKPSSVEGLNPTSCMNRYLQYLELITKYIYACSLNF